MIELDEQGGLRFRGRLERDDPGVAAVIGALSDKIAECIALALDAIERGEIRVFRMLMPNWFAAEQCGFWIHFSVAPDQEWAKVVLLARVG